jgi:transposase
LFSPALNLKAAHLLRILTRNMSYSAKFVTTAVINSIRAYLAEFGIVAPVGRGGVEALLEVVANANDTRLPEIARACVAALGTQLLGLKTQILAFDRRIMAWHRSNETSKRLDEIPGVGPALATALVASVADPKAFRSGRDFSAWIGLVPKQNSSGGKDKLGSISKQGDRYLRPLYDLLLSGNHGIKVARCRTEFCYRHT